MNVELERRRSAPVHERTSDVTRTRGWLAGVLGGAAALAAVLAVELSVGGAASLGPSRALSPPHTEAGLSCESCHRSPEESGAEQGEAAAIAEACVGCHGPHPSTRPGHRRMAAEGRLGCPTCHAIHDGHGGVTLTTGAATTRWRDGASWALPASAGVPEWTGARQHVALVEVSACARCHEPTRSDDPMAYCIGARRPGEGPLDPRTPALCFDEHQLLLDAAGTERAAAWELARAAAVADAGAGEVQAPGQGGEDSEGGGWLRLLGQLAAVLAGGAVAWAGARHLRGRASVDPRTLAGGAPEAGAAAPVEASLRPAERRRLPTIDATTCIGCMACIDACPYDVLELQRYVATVARPDDCCGLSLCEQRCPNGSLVIAEGERVPDLPMLDEGLRAQGAPGVYLAGDITGLPLIRNAINQGAHAVRSLASELAAEGQEGGGEGFDLVIVGAGPAGIAAALEAKEQGLRACVLEQGSVAESIRSFPRGKLVFDQPLGVPRVGELWLEESTKEELLGKWLRIVHREGLDIREGLRVTGCERRGGTLRVLAEAAASEDSSEHGEAAFVDARRVLLALGRRGTPRRLGAPIADAMVDHVHYSLADARSFAGKRVLVVGLGDVAMEAAAGLAHQPGTRVTVAYRGPDFKRGKRRNIDTLRRLASTGRVELLWSTTVEAIEPGRARLLGPKENTQDLAVDCVFVMIGNVAPTALLEAFGVSAS